MIFLEVTYIPIKKTQFDGLNHQFSLACHLRQYCSTTLRKMSNITTTVGTICADLPPPSALFIDAKASAALALMQKSNFSSVVVLDKEQVCVGVLSLVDFVNYASQAGYFATDRPQVSKRSGKDSPQRLREESDETWLSQTLSEVLGKDSESTSIAVLQPTDRVSSTYGILGGGTH